jgi:SnoaL-like protein
MTPSVIQRWIDIVDGDRADDIDDILAPDCVFYSPAVFTPQEGRAKAATYLKAASKLFAGTDFRYVGHWYGDHSAVLEFAATIDGMQVDGIDMIGWNQEDRVVSFKVMVRPFKGLQVVMGRMAELLQAG